jgi:hypothetical protein
MCASLKGEVGHLVGSEQLRNSVRFVPQLTTFNHQLISCLNVSLLYDASQITHLVDPEGFTSFNCRKTSNFIYYPRVVCVEF